MNGTTANGATVSGTTVSGGSGRAAVRGKRIAVVGASGFIGRRLCHRVRAEGGELTVLARPASDLTSLPRDGVRRVTATWGAGRGWRTWCATPTPFSTWAASPRC